MTTRNGNYSITFTGQKFYPFDPRPDEIYIKDIAHHLSLICRFGGATPWFYSVAEHSLWVSKLSPPPDRLWGLLHDAAEAYLGDMIRPVKRHPGLAPFIRAESVLLSAIMRKFGLPPEQPASVRNADELMLGIEGYNLNGHIPDNCTADPDYCRNIKFHLSLSPIQAERQFLARFQELTK